jgi:catalase
MCPFASFQRDGHMQRDVPKGRANYEPNSLAEANEAAGPRECPVSGFGSFAEPVSESKQRVRAASFADHYSQARLFYGSMLPPEQAHIASAFTFELSKVEREVIRTRMLANLRNVDESLAKRVAAGLAMPLPAAAKPAAEVKDLGSSPKLSIIGNMHKTLQGRVLGALIHDGSDGAVLHKLRETVTKAGGVFKLVAPKVGSVELKGGSEIKPDGQLAGTPSIVFDAVALVLSSEGVKALLADATAVQFVMDAFGHLKEIGHTPEAQPLLDKAGVQPDGGVVPLDRWLEAAAARYFEREAKVRPLA